MSDRIHVHIVKHIVLGQIWAKLVLAICFKYRANVPCARHVHCKFLKGSNSSGLEPINIVFL